MMDSQSQAGKLSKLETNSTQKRKMIMNRRQHSQAKQQLNNLKAKELLVVGMEAPNPQRQHWYASSKASEMVRGTQKNARQLVSC